MIDLLIESMIENPFQQLEDHDLVILMIVMVNQHYFNELVLEDIYQ
jgi:hypothetical protein